MGGGEATAVRFDSRNASLDGSNCREHGRTRGAHDELNKSTLNNINHEQKEHTKKVGETLHRNAGAQRAARYLERAAEGISPRDR
jgi:hypothetical protein